MEELRTFSLAAVLAAARSFAIGGPRAPRCGGVNSPTAAGDTTGHASKRRRTANRTPIAAVAAGDEGGEHLYRGITRDNNGRQQWWIALLYAGLE
jgi:hypothetical protein